MTKNQIEYQRLQEEKRANARQEALTQRRDEAAIGARTVELTETQRHNLATEDAALRDIMNKEVQTTIQQQNADTNVRNAETNARNADTNARNAATNERNAATNERNADINYENAISNRMQAESGYIAANAAETSAGAAATSAAAAYFNAMENQRHNQATESETKRHNTRSEWRDMYEVRTKRGEAESVINMNNARADLYGAQTTTERNRSDLIAEQAAGQRKQNVYYDEFVNSQIFSNYVRSGTDALVGGVKTGATIVPLIGG